MSLSHSSATDMIAEPDEDVLSLESSDLAYSALLASSREEQDVAALGEDVLIEPSQPACPKYSELLEVMAHATQWLDLPWKLETAQFARGRLVFGPFCGRLVKLPLKVSMVG